MSYVTVPSHSLYVFLRLALSLCLCLLRLRMCYSSINIINVPVLVAKRVFERVTLLSLSLSLGLSLRAVNMLRVGSRLVSVSFSLLNLKFEAS